MLKLETTKKFRKQYAQMTRRGYDISKLDYVIQKLLNQEQLDRKYEDHALKGDHKGYRECHVAPDWFLVYAVDKGNLVLTASETGSHSDIF